MTDETGPTEKTGLIQVSRIYTEGGEIVREEADEETIEVRTFKSDVATIDFGIGMTLNLGNYESVRVNVGITLPTYIEQQEAAYASAKKFVDTKLNEEVDKIRTYRKEKDKKGT